MPSSNVKRMPDKSQVSISNVRSDIALLTLEAGDDGRVNLGDTLLEEVDRAMETLASQTGLAGVIVRSTGRLSFAQAWDIDRLQERFDWDDQQIIRYSQRGRAVLARLSRCPCLLYTSPSPRDATLSRMPSSA